MVRVDAVGLATDRNHGARPLIHLGAGAFVAGGAVVPGSAADSAAPRRSPRCLLAATRARSMACHRDGGAPRGRRRWLALTRSSVAVSHRDSGAPRGIYRGMTVLARLLHGLIGR